MTQPFIKAFFDEPTNTISYLVSDPATRVAAVIDPVLDFDLASGVADTRSAERIVAFAAEHDWRIEMMLETHAHADHLSAAPFIKARTGAWIGIGTNIRDVQKIFRPVFAMDDLKTDGSDFDRLFDDGDRFGVGGLQVEVLHVPGHTSADVAYLIGDAAFVGDTLFMPDYGTARADFPRRRRANAVPFGPPPPVTARRDATVPVSRLQGTWAHRIRMGNDCRRAAARQRSCSRRRD